MAPVLVLSFVPDLRFALSVQICSLSTEVLADLQICPALLVRYPGAALLTLWGTGLVSPVSHPWLSPKFSVQTRHFCSSLARASCVIILRDKKGPRDSCKVKLWKLYLFLPEFLGSKHKLTVLYLKIQSIQTATLLWLKANKWHFKSKIITLMGFEQKKFQWAQLL